MINFIALYAPLTNVLIRPPPSNFGSQYNQGSVKDVLGFLRLLGEFLEFLIHPLDDQA